jgi:hypothetical protein
MRRTCRPMGISGVRGRRRQSRVWWVRKGIVYDVRRLIKVVCLSGFGYFERCMNKMLFLAGLEWFVFGR